MRHSTGVGGVRRRVVVATLPLLAASAAPAQPFAVEEATVAGIHAAMRAHRVTARRLVELYLRRIAEYDEAGPHVNSLIVVSPAALRTADSLDAILARTGRLVGPLHGVPVIVKDNIDTGDLPTTAGSLALAGSRPARDATVVRRLRAAGAIVLAKSNLPDFASSAYETVSSVLPGYTRNPYDLERTTAGSSGGTAAAVAANFGAVGLGTDTGNSIRGPAAFLALVGLRPTTGLVSRDGVVPLDPARDVTGPMTRTVADAALVLTVIAGEDPADTLTRLARGRVPGAGYSAALTRDGLRGARVGVLRGLSDTPTSDPEVLARFSDALEAMRRAGAVLVDPANIPDLDVLAQRTPFECRPFRAALAEYLARLGPRAPVHSLEEILRSGKFHTLLEARFRLYQQAPEPDANPDCRAADARAARLRAAVERLVDGERLDALVYPSWNNPPRLLGDLNTPHGSNGPRIASVVGFPAITVPMGRVRRGTLPVGVELLGVPWSEPTLLRLAYAYEQATHLRAPPPSTPPLRERIGPRRAR